MNIHRTFTLKKPLSGLGAIYSFNMAATALFFIPQVILDQEEARRGEQEYRRDDAKHAEVARDHVDHSHKRARATERTHEVQH